MGRVSSLLCFLDVVRMLMRCRPMRVRKEDVDKPELLVPIRLELDVEHHKLRDTFVWNLNGIQSTPIHVKQH